MALLLGVFWSSIPLASLSALRCCEASYGQILMPFFPLDSSKDQLLGTSYIIHSPIDMDVTWVFFVYKMFRRLQKHDLLKASLFFKVRVRRMETTRPLWSFSLVCKLTVLVHIGYRKMISKIYPSNTYLSFMKHMPSDIEMHVCTIKNIDVWRFIFSQMVGSYLYLGTFCNKLNPAIGKKKLNSNSPNSYSVLYL